MDDVTARNPGFLTFKQLVEAMALSTTEQQLVKGLAAPYEDFGISYLPLSRGLSDSKKIIMKPRTLYPFLIKLGSKVHINQEVRGDQLIRLRAPSQNLPFLAGEDFAANKGALLYRYITGGRIGDPVVRLDSFLTKADWDGRFFEGTDTKKGEGQAKEILSEKIQDRFEGQYSSNIDSKDRHLIFGDIFDVVLKKVHWQDAQFERLPVNLPEISEPRKGFTNASYRDEILHVYTEVKKAVDGTLAPHGIIHGDLHTKNVLVTRNREPILLDFAMAQERQCIFIDYVKLEHCLQFQLSLDYTEQFFRKELNLRSYSADPLILPRSHHGVAKLIHEIRSILWKTCLSNTVGMNHIDIDKIYRGYLIYYLGRFSVTSGVSDTNRIHAYKEALNLAKGII